MDIPLFPYWILNQLLVFIFPYWIFPYVAYWILLDILGWRESEKGGGEEGRGWVRRGEGRVCAGAGVKGERGCGRVRGGERGERTGWGG